MVRLRINQVQLFTILVNLVFGKAIGYSSEVTVRWVGNDGWLAMLLAFAGGIPLMALMVWLASRFGEETPQQYISRVLGRFVGTAVMLGLSLFLLGSFLTSAITIAQHINDYLMPETPLIVFIILYTLLCLYGVHLGIEVAARLSVLGFALLVLLDALMVAGSLDHFVTERLLPLMDHGLLPVLQASTAAHTDVAMATVAALLLLPLTGRPQRWYRLTLWGLAAGAVFTSVWTIFEIAVMGPEVTAQYLIACMQMARSAQLSIYLHRYELVMVILFAYSVMTQSIICLYGGCELLQAALPKRVARRRGLLISAVAAATIAGQYVLAVDRDRYGLFLSGPWPVIAMALGYGLPVLLAVVALLRPGVREAAPSPTPPQAVKPPPWQPPSV